MIESNPPIEAPRASKKAVRGLGFALRLAVTGLLVLWLVRRIDVAAALELLRAARLPLVATGVLSVLTTLLLTCWRWRLCLLEDQERLPFRTIVVSYWTSLFIGTALPTEYGGDVLRVRDVWERIGDGSRALASVFWSRLSGIAATFLVFNLVGLVLLDRLVELSLVWAWTISSVTFVVLAAVVFLRPVSSLTMPILESLPVPQRLRSATISFLRRARDLATHPRFAWRIAALAVVAEALMIASNYLFVLALGQSVRPSDLALVMPLVTLSSLLPISLGGIGVKEGAFVVSLSAIGLTSEEALSVALLNRLVLLVVAFTGGCLFPLRGRLMKDNSDP